MFKTILAPASGYGEGSMALASELGLPSDPRSGGYGRRDLIYVVHSASSGFPKDAKEVRSAGAKAFATWGGAERLSVCVTELRKMPQ